MANAEGYISKMKMFIYRSNPAITPSELWKRIWKTIALKGNADRWNTNDETKLGIKVDGVEFILGPYKKDHGAFQHHLIIAILHDELEDDQTAEVYGELLKPIISFHRDEWERIMIKVDTDEFSPLELSAE